jgi:hypothetical protein
LGKGGSWRRETHKKIDRRAWALSLGSEFIPTLKFGDALIWVVVKTKKPQTVKKVLPEPMP